MFRPLPHHDAIAGAGIALWVVGMGLVLGIEETSTQMLGAVLWAVGLIIAIAAAARTYVSAAARED